MATHLELSTLMYSFLHRSLLSLGLNLGKLDSWPMPVANPVPGWIYDLSQQLLRNRAIQQYHSTPYSVGICFLLMQSIELRCVASPSSADRNLCGCTRQSGSPTLNHSFATGRKRLVGNGYTHIDAYAKITIAQLN